MDNLQPILDSTSLSVILYGMTEIRLCKKCGREKLLIDFPYSHKSKGFRRHECHSCHTSRMNISYLKHKDNRKQRAMGRYKKNPSPTWTRERKDKVNSDRKVLALHYRELIINHYGGECACCGEDDIRFLTLDYMNNDGSIMRKLHGIGIRLYRWIMKNDYPDSFQVLCYNCNCGRATNGGICPHKVEAGSTTISQESTLQAIGNGSARRLPFLSR